MPTTRLPRSLLAGLIPAGVLLCAITAVVTATGSSSEYAGLEAFARALTVAAPIGVGIYALYRPPFQRFGALLTLVGFVWFVTTLSNSDDEVLYSIGRIAGWLVEPLLLYALLAFPSGRLQNRTDRALVGAEVLLVAVLYLPSVLLAESYPAPGPWMSCDSDCPGNAFMVTATQPAIIEDLVRPLRELITVLLFTAVAVRLALRIRGASRLVRRTVTPVLVAAAFRVAIYGGAVIVRRVAPDSTVSDAWMWLLAYTVPLICLAFLVGLARWWLFMARATGQLAARLRGHPGPEELRAALADTFDDPTLEIVYWLEDGGWVDAAGHPRPDPALTPGRCVTEIADGDRRVAAIVHDRALGDDQVFVDTATSFTLMTLDNHRLTAQAASLLRDVGELRSSLRDAADDERKRIERDLHDGAQQRLVALGIRLGLAAETTGDRTAAVMRALGDEVEHALDELRSLARGENPVPGGLVEGLHAAAQRNPLPTRVSAAGVQRYPSEIESAVYFCCLEALQNAAKHARATAIAVELSDTGALRLEVHDDGVGFDRDQVAPGLGLRSMHERLAAVGGELEITSTPGHGTRVIARVPL